MATRKKTDEFGNETVEVDEIVTEATEEQAVEPVQEETVVEPEPIIEPAPVEPEPIIEPAPVEPEPVVEAIVEPVVETAPVIEEKAKKSTPVSSAVKLAGDIVKAHRPTRIGRTRCC
jgi:fused signal recognition particle receptor